MLFYFFVYNFVLYKYFLFSYCCTLWLDLNTWHYFFVVDLLSLLLLLLMLLLRLLLLLYCWWLWLLCRVVTKTQNEITSTIQTDFENRHSVLCLRFCFSLRISFETPETAHIIIIIYTINIHTERRQAQQTHAIESLWDKFTCKLVELSKWTNVMQRPAALRRRRSRCSTTTTAHTRTRTNERASAHSTPHTAHRQILTHSHSRTQLAWRNQFSTRLPMRHARKRDA